jgi:predicted ArsR family transcriptional regulator
MAYEHDKSGDKPTIIITRNDQPITARQAAEVIGITVHAVRKRLKKVRTKTITIENLQAGRTG